MLTDSLCFDCPWCGEANHVEQEPGDAAQWLVQDCAVCCRPIELKLPSELDPELRVQQEGGG
ncbi:CPXCG motif-containing cysteine-rich protein [Wenzhouxiangella sp. XN79A]|uniref:CPXCG motif-containing cysteine-rich protein n=1 Tax=Wenzhouxiangella sp. XN79A TaxID=2724193 RepID=UPI00144AAA29|nr:CPXCG motif-containing cysteine-rich protein [Wenzhouxiangella sp. XN79A]NKI34951.1 CPXCG motif-containing cysteine-rich protein [Wenzhouxiangella sp. XN79A]